MVVLFVLLRDGFVFITDVMEKTEGEARLKRSQQPSAYMGTEVNSNVVKVLMVPELTLGAEYGF